MTNYLPKHATAPEACEWLATETGEPWTLARLLEHSLKPWLWLEYEPGRSDIFGDRTEGYLAPMLFGGDTARLAAVGTDALLTMTKTPDGVPFRMTPGLSVPIDALRFQREDLMRLAGKLSAPAAKVEAAPAASPSDDDWRAQARMIADECFDRDTANNCRDTLKNYSKRVMEAMQERGIKGPRGIIDNANHVMREALVSDFWWANKSK